MIALILNSGLGSRMGNLTDNKPKCMVNLFPSSTIIDQQLQTLISCKITEVVITTGPFEEQLKQHLQIYEEKLSITYVHNPEYQKTNYIYSILLASQLLRGNDIILMHGDLVFTERLLNRVMKSETSVMVIDRDLPLPEKDFKAVISGDRITKIGIGYFEHAFAAQPLYKLTAANLSLWLDEISAFCLQGNTDVYAENAFNHISDKLPLFPLDALGELCMEVDTKEDLDLVKVRLNKEKP